ncbi:hypothetical protein [Novosphingobium sp.]|uniref:hypothetical protein n=1 Tax=Novosphingobium sp. TaxID=1874826 RepID=UPI0035B254BA
MRETIWRWIKRVTLAIVAFLAFLSMILLCVGVYEKHRLAQLNRTYERPLSEDEWIKSDINSYNLLARLKPVKGDDTLKMIAMPSFGKRWFAASISVVNGQGVGEVIVSMTCSPDCYHSEVESRSFMMVV